MQVFRYNDKAKLFSGAETDPQPWLHCIFVDERIIVYVWDTREVVEVARCASYIDFDDLVLAKDSHTPLVGLGDLQYLNAKLGFEDNN